MGSQFLGAGDARRMGQREGVGEEWLRAPARERVGGGCRALGEALRRIADRVVQVKDKQVAFNGPAGRRTWDLCTASPIFVRRFTSMLKGRIAPVGHTCVQKLQS